MRDQRRHRARFGLAGGVSVLAAVASVSLVGLTTASAAPNLPPGNSIVIGSGSQTAYSLMSGLDDLFNSSQGCNEIAATGTSQVQSLSFNCPTGAVGLPAANGENPLNDVALQEPPLGGSNGLKQLEGQVPVDGTTPISFATTVRNPVSTDPAGLNFVNYGDDAVSWFHFTKVGKKATASANIHSLTILDLENIWLGKIKNWDAIPGAKGGNAPIKVYVTNSGSGLLSIWNSSLGSINAQTYPETEGKSYVIEQNEDASIIKNGNEADAIFFFSNGRYQQTCKEGTCGGSPIPGGGTTALGNINSVALTSANILSGKWPVRVFLSNVYSDGSNLAIPTASQATLNYVSEDGFLCKTQLSKGVKIIDPVTRVWYRTEITNLITGGGFVPLPAGKEGIVPHPAVIKQPYKGYDPGATDPTGYCRVSTTDGNA
jgi:ABC-type phosphate transport system substrate-binding protein